MEIHCKFQNTTIVSLRNDQKFVKMCETFEALCRFRENIIDLSL